MVSQRAPGTVLDDYMVAVFIYKVAVVVSSNVRVLQRFQTLDFLDYLSARSLTFFVEPLDGDFLSLLGLCMVDSAEATLA